VCAASIADRLAWAQLDGSVPRFSALVHVSPRASGSTTRDAPARCGSFFQLPGPGVEAGLGALATEMAPYDIWRHFYVTGSSHTTLGTLGVSQNGVTVRTFLTQMVGDDAGWASVEP
jgi:hypothetical protein